MKFDRFRLARLHFLTYCIVIELYLCFLYIFCIYNILYFTHHFKLNIQYKSLIGIQKLTQCTIYSMRGFFFFYYFDSICKYWTNITSIFYQLYSISAPCFPLLNNRTIFNRQPIRMAVNPKGFWNTVS